MVRHDPLIELADADYCRVRDPRVTQCVPSGEPSSMFSFSTWFMIRMLNAQSYVQDAPRCMYNLIDMHLYLYIQFD